MRSIGLYLLTGSYLLSVVVCCIARPSLAVQVGSIVVLLSVAALSFRMHRAWKYPILVAVGCMLGCARVAMVPTQLPEEFSRLINQKAEITGTVIALPDVRETNTHIFVQVDQGTAHTRVLAIVPHFPEVHVGDIVTLSGTLSLPKPFDGDGGRTFPYPEFLRKDGVYAVMQRGYVSRNGSSKSSWLLLLRTLESIKLRFMDQIERAIPEPESALAEGIIVGGKQGLGQRLIDAFSKAGMLQIVVLSGYNVMIVAEMIMQVLADIPKRIAFTLASLSIIGFVLIAGAGSSALRAAVMALIAIYARTSKKRYSVLRALTAAVLLLGLVNPLMLVYDPGFQFSCIATLGLVLGVPCIEPKLLFLRNALLIELVSTTLAAEVALLPFLLWQSGNLSTVSVFANVIAMPVIPFCMAASTLAALITFPLAALSPTLPLIAGLPSYLGLAYVLKVATVSASFPFALYVIPAFPFWIVVVLYMLMLGAVFHIRKTAPIAGSRFTHENSPYPTATPLRQGSGAPPRPNSRSP